MMETRQVPKISFLGFVTRTTILHVITYFAFGFIFAFMNPLHQGVHTIELFPEYQFLFKSIDSLWVIGGGLLQIIRGPIIMAALYPYREVFLGRKNGWLLLAALMISLTLLGAVVAGPGSLEGYFYTNMPLELHLDGMPEVITQMIGFSFLVPIWEFNKSKWVNVGFIAAFVLIVFMLSMGVYVNI